VAKSLGEMSALFDPSSLTLQRRSRPITRQVAPRSNASESFWNFRLSLFASDSSLR
jgi:hypothetical protein